MVFPIVSRSFTSPSSSDGLGDWPCPLCPVGHSAVLLGAPDRARYRRAADQTVRRLRALRQAGPGARHGDLKKGAKRHAWLAAEVLIGRAGTQSETSDSGMVGSLWPQHGG